MADPSPVLGDPDRPASARVYNFLLGGIDWYDPDRELAAKLEAIYPGLRNLAKTNQEYLVHAVLWASAHQGIRQFLDLGSGFPAASSVRDIAQAADRDAVVACVDWDPVVAHPRYGYGPVLDRMGVKNVSLVLADVRDVDEVLAAPGIGPLDFSEPVMAVFGLVLNHMAAGDAEKAVKAYADVLAPGSAVAITTARNDDEDTTRRLGEQWRQDTGTKGTNYTLPELEALFDGLEVQPPGIGPIAGRRPGWKDAKAEQQGTTYVIGGIGIKPLPQRQNKRPR